MTAKQNLHGSEGDVGDQRKESKGGKKQAPNTSPQSEDVASDLDENDVEQSDSHEKGTEEQQANAGKGQPPTEANDNSPEPEEVDEDEIKAPTNWAQYRSWESIPELNPKFISTLKVRTAAIG